MKKQRHSRQRQVVLGAVLARKDHPTADQIYLELRERDPKISRGTVYRNLNLLAELGEIGQIKTPAADRFDWRCETHYHLLCNRCGALVDTEIPYNQALDQLLRKEGFVVERHHLLFEGLCQSCEQI